MGSGRRRAGRGGRCTSIIRGGVGDRGGGNIWGWIEAVERQTAEGRSRKGDGKGARVRWGQIRVASGEVGKILALSCTCSLKQICMQI